MKSQHFDIVQITPGVMAAIHKTGGHGICNAGIIDLGDRTLLFDPFLSSQAAVDLKVAAEVLTGQRVTLLVNSHHHADHWWSNSVFPGNVEIISATTTRVLMESAGIEEYLGYKQAAAADLVELERVLQSKSHQRPWPPPSLRWVEYYRAIVKNLPGLTFRFPDLTFERQLWIHGSARSVLLFCLRHSHSACDTLAFVPEAGVLFAGDIVTVDTHPYLGESTPEGYQAALGYLKNLAPRWIIPGHGAPGSPTDLFRLEDYYSHIQTRAVQLLNASEEALLSAAEELPKEFVNWEFSDLYLQNLRSVRAQIMPSPQPDASIQAAP